MQQDNQVIQEQPKKRLIQVKCLYPHDESWQKNKVYTCEVWHHGDLNRDFCADNTDCLQWIIRNAATMSHILKDDVPKLYRYGEGPFLGDPRCWGRS